jgi:hypothetical protein
MPLASSNDLILAGIQDILATLANPSANSPLAPLTDSHTEALRTVSSILTGLASPQPAKHTLRPATDPTPTIALQPKPNTAPPPLRVEPSLPTIAQPLRVEPAAATTAPALRVDPSTALSPPKPVQAAPTPKLAPATTPNQNKLGTEYEPPATFTNSTGPAGKRRRKRAAQRKAAQSKPTKAPATKFHNHGTRANRRRQTASANSTQVMSNTLPTAFEHQALHGNAFNPDTGQIAEYPELYASAVKAPSGKPAPLTKLVVSSKDWATKARFH